MSDTFCRTLFSLPVLLLFGQQDKMLDVFLKNIGRPSFEKAIELKKN